jgi:chloramphenicol 3-O phosphotransferase
VADEYTWGDDRQCRVLNGTAYLAVLPQEALATEDIGHDTHILRRIAASRIIVSHRIRRVTLQRAAMAPGSIVFLNGTSSAGKTSIARALRERTSRPAIHLQVDQLILAIPEHYWPSVDPAVGMATFESVIAGYHHCLAALVATGNHVIADHVLQEPSWWAECARLLAPFPAYLVTVFCPLEELERREQARGDREIGLARRQFAQIYGPMQHDLRVDTSQDSPEACAEQIHAFVQSGAQPSAFRRIVTEGIAPLG